MKAKGLSISAFIEFSSDKGSADFGKTAHRIDRGWDKILLVCNICKTSYDYWYFASISGEPNICFFEGIFSGWKKWPLQMIIM